MTKEKKITKTNHSKKLVGTGLILTIGFLFLLFLFGFTNYCSTLPSGTTQCISKYAKFWQSSPSEVGDTFAGIAGALAFFWIILTVMLQSKELEAQREVLTAQMEELKAQQQELALSRKEAETANENMGYQLFENTFSSLLITYNDILKSIDLHSNTRTGTKVTVGRDALLTFYSRLHRRFDNSEVTENKLDNTYKIFWADHSSELAHYFRFLYRAFKHIEESKYSQPQHGKILRALLSDQELLLIFYNCLNDQGKKFEQLAIKFEIFDNLPMERLFEEEHWKLIDIRAWGDNKGLKKKKLINS